jgi:hypothetical protein
MRSCPNAAFLRQGSEDAYANLRLLGVSLDGLFPANSGLGIEVLYDIAA